MLTFCLGPVKVYNEERLIHHHNGSEITLRYDFNQGCSARAGTWQKESEPKAEIEQERKPLPRATFFSKLGLDQNQATLTFCIMNLNPL